MKYIHIIGAGLAGSEAAYQIAKRGYKVKLYEMRPNPKAKAHHTSMFAELVCSNSLKSNSLENAAGLLKEEMRMLDSLIIRSADMHSVPAGQALAVDRDLFSLYITEQIKNNPNIEIIYEEVTNVEYTNRLYQIYTTGKVYISRYLIIAVGSTPKKIKGLKASYCEICEGHLYKGKSVAVIGGGDSSFSCSLYLSKICKSVTILIRKDKAKASKYLIDKVKETNNIETKYKSNVIEDSKEYEGTFVKIGNVINLEPFKNVIEKHDNTFLIGDCTGLHCNQIIKSEYEGMAAALKIIEIEKLN